MFFVNFSVKSSRFDLASLNFFDYHLMVIKQGQEQSLQTKWQEAPPHLKYSSLIDDTEKRNILFLPSHLFLPKVDYAHA